MSIIPSNRSIRRTGSELADLARPALFDSIDSIVETLASTRTTLKRSSPSEVFAAAHPCTNEERKAESDGQTRQRGHVPLLVAGSYARPTGNVAIQLAIHVPLYFFCCLAGSTQKACESLRPKHGPVTETSPEVPVASITTRRRLKGAPLTAAVRPGGTSSDLLIPIRIVHP